MFSRSSYLSKSIHNDSKANSSGGFYKNLRKEMDEGKLCFYEGKEKNDYSVKKRANSKASKHKYLGEFKNVYVMSQDKKMMLSKGGSVTKKEKKNTSYGKYQLKLNKPKPQSTRAKFGFSKKFTSSLNKNTTFTSKRFKSKQKKPKEEKQERSKNDIDKTHSIEPIKFSQDDKRVVRRKKKYLFKDRVNPATKPNKKMYLTQLKIPDMLEHLGDNNRCITPEVGMNRFGINFQSPKNKTERKKENRVREERLDRNFIQMGSNSPKPTSSMNSLIIYDTSSKNVSYENSAAIDMESKKSMEDELESNISVGSYISKDVFQRKSELIVKIKQEVEEEGTIPKTTLDFYQISNLLGEGAYGKVFMGKSLLLGEPVAIKCFDKSKVKSDSNFNRIIQEVQISKELYHKNIIKFYEIFENKKFIFLVLEYANNKDLLTYLKEHGIFTEAQFRPILVQMLDALKYLHSKKILHRDIKLDNILLNNKNEVKLCDFGVSRRMTSKKPIYEHIGTPAYLAPEIVSKVGYTGYGADIWSLGVTSLIALTGYVPFKGDTIEELAFSILNKNFDFDDSCNLSKEMQFILKGMLAKKVEKRLSIDDVLSILKVKLYRMTESDDEELSPVCIKKIMKYGYTEEQILFTLENQEINHINCLNRLLLSRKLRSKKSF